MRTQVRDGKLCFTEYKGRDSAAPKYHELPIIAPLAESIAAYDEGRVEGGFIYFILTEFGKQHSAKGLGNYFKRQCRLAGIDKELSLIRQSQS